MTPRELAAELRQLKAKGSLGAVGVAQGVMLANLAMILEALDGCVHVGEGYRLTAEDMDRIVNECGSGNDLSDAIKDLFLAHYTIEALTAERDALKAVADKFSTVMTCACGDVRYGVDMCHICGKCQMGCCMCGEQIALSKAERLFISSRTESEIEDFLSEKGLDFSRIGWDYYDCSIEIYEAPSESALTAEMLEFLKGRGFGLIYLNRLDGTELHYNVKEGGGPWLCKDREIKKHPRRIERELKSMTAERDALKAVADKFSTVMTCACGDVRYGVDMCHICGKCQMGCCMCGEVVADTKAQIANLKAEVERLRGALAVIDL